MKILIYLPLPKNEEQMLEHRPNIDVSFLSITSKAKAFVQKNQISCVNVKLLSKEFVNEL